jgi:plasmid stabilization system protein ParE
VRSFLQTKSSAQIILGPAAAQAVARLLRAEFRNQALRQPASYHSPEAALASAQRWLVAIRALKEGRSPNLYHLPVEPAHVLPHRLEVHRAAQALGIPKGILTAIVDSEQMGGDKVFGFSREVRQVADVLAAELAQNLGDSGGAGLVSQTVGLAQMSWQDALKQEARLRRFVA